MSGRALRGAFLRNELRRRAKPNQYPGPLVMRSAHGQGLFIFLAVAPMRSSFALYRTIFYTDLTQRVGLAYIRCIHADCGSSTEMSQDAKAD